MSLNVIFLAKFKCFNFFIQLILPEGAQPRRGHSATAFKLSPGIVEVTMFGGCPKFVPGGDPQQQPKISDTTVVRLGEQITEVSLNRISQFKTQLGHCACVTVTTSFISNFHSL